MNPIESSCSYQESTSADLEADQGHSLLSNSSDDGTIAAPEGINAIAAALESRQQRAREVAVLIDASTAAARRTEAELRDAVTAMRETVHNRRAHQASPKTAGQ